MNVLVVGGAGYVGGAITDLLRQTDHSQRVYDVLLYEEEYRKPVDFVYGDVRDQEKLLGHLEWADTVVWLAGIVGDTACALNPKVSVAVNQESVRWLAERFDGRIIFLSTCSVYGDLHVLLDESSPTNPLSVYALTKLEAEGYLVGKNALIFRLGTLFGLSDLFSRVRFDLVVNVLTLRAYQTSKITVYGGDQFRPLLHVRDAAQAVVDNLTTEYTGVFVLHKQNVRIIDLAHQVSSCFPDLLIEQTEAQFEDVRSYRVSSEEARTTLGFDPARSVDEGIEEVKALLESSRLKRADSLRYSNHGFLSMHMDRLQ